MAALKSRFPDINGPRAEDICYATSNRQSAVKSIAAKCDLLLVIGAPNSSNSLRLVEVAERTGTNARLIQRWYDIGVFPDWWKLEPMQSDAAWAATCDAINARDPHVQGIVVLGLGQSEAELASSFRLAAKYPLVKGFAVGRTIHANVGRDWIAGKLDDATAVATMAANYRRLVGYWDDARKGKGAAE